MNEPTKGMMVLLMNRDKSVAGHTRIEYVAEDLGDGQYAVVDKFGVHIIIHWTHGAWEEVIAGAKESFLCRNEFTPTHYPMSEDNTGGDHG